MRRWLIILGGLLIPAAVWAHSGAGQPYVIINGQYAPGNPAAALYLDMAQDIAPSVYQTGQEIRFNIDTNLITADAFRWHWDKDQTTDGTAATHIFTTDGTHTVTVQAKNNSDANFADLDTLEVSTAPTAGYKAPTAKIKVSQIGQDSAGQTVTLEAVSPSGSAAVKDYQWRFGDGVSANGQSVTHTYKGAQWIFYPKLRMVDANGIWSDLVIQLQASPKGVVGDDLPVTKGILAGSITRTASRSQLPWVAAGIGVILLSLLGWLARKQLRQS